MHLIHPFLYGLNPRAVWHGLLVILLAASAAAVICLVRPKPGSVLRPRLVRLGAASILILLVLQFAVTAAYLVFPGYLDHAEPAIAATSWLGWQGGPLYPSFETGDVYGVVYGPILLQANGLALWLLGPSVVASKILGVGAFVSAQILAFIIFRRSGATAMEALTIAGAQCVVQSAFNEQGLSFGVRSDPLLFLASEFSVLAAISRPTNVNAALLGLAAGVAVNLKIHGALYILPSFVFFLCQIHSKTTGVRLILVSAVTAMTISVAPFLLNNVSLSFYLQLLQITLHQEIERWLLEKNVVFALMSLTPILWFYLFFAPKLPRGFGWFFTSTIVCMGITAIVGAIQGAGPHHLLPFLPSLFWAFFVVRRRAENELTGPVGRALLEGGTLGLIVALLFGYGPILAISWDRTLSQFARAPLVQIATDEINNALDHNPGLRVAVGPGTSPGFDAMKLRVIPVFHGNPLPVDTFVWMDADLAGVSDRIVSGLLRECRVDIWLLPVGIPFLLEGYFPGRNLFSDDVLTDFYESYDKQEGSGRVFDQWRCTQNALIGFGDRTY